MADHSRKDTRGAAPRMVGRVGAALLAGAVALLCPTIAGAAGTPTPGAGAGAAGTAASPSAVVATLSNLRTLSRWAYPQSSSPARVSPSAHAHVDGSLHFLTPDGQAEVYIELRSYKLHGAEWIDVEVPGRPNGRTGWVPASALGEAHVTHEYLRVDRESLHVTLFRDGHTIWSAPVGVGRRALPTPAGHFYITEKLETIGGPVYGPFAFGTSAYAPTLSEWPGGGIVGIHGTDEPQLIPGYPSHGCIRLRNNDIAALFGLVEVGTPLEIV